MGYAGSAFITREGAELMMTQLLAEYEEEKVEPRHRETQGSIAELKQGQDKLTAIVTKGNFLKDIIKQVPNVIALVWLIIQIFDHVKH